jgi:hypothetical protein
MENYNIAANSWSAGASTTLPHVLGAAVTGPDSRIYGLGGNGGTTSSPIEGYDEGIGAWSQCLSGLNFGQCQPAQFAPMPTWRLGLGAAVGSDGRIYAIGGSQNGTVLNMVQVYARYPWVVAPGLNHPEGAPATTVGPAGLIYEVGGFHESNSNTIVDATVQSFSTKTGVWTNHASMPTARSVLGAATGSNGLVYAMGGGNSFGTLAIVEAFNAATGKWTCSVGDAATGCTTSTIKPMLVARQDFSTVSMNGLIYVLGNNNFTDGKCLPGAFELDAYNPKTNTWTKKASDPAGGTAPRCQAHMAVGKNGKIYVFRDSSNGVPSAEGYNPATNTWSSIASPAIRLSLGIGGAAGLGDGKIYLVRTDNGSSSTVDTEVDAYNPATNSYTKVTVPALWTNFWPSAFTNNAVVGGPDGRVYAAGGFVGTAPTAQVEAFTP